MPKPEKFDINEVMLKAIPLAYKRAWETAVRTGTSLVFYKDGKIVNYKPPYKYVLVPIKPRKKKAR